MDYLICKKFGWTVEEVNSLPQTKYEEIIAIMNIEQQFQTHNSNKLKNMSSKYGK